MWQGESYEEAFHEEGERNGGRYVPVDGGVWWRALYTALASSDPDKSNIFRLQWNCIDL